MAALRSPARTRPPFLRWRTPATQGFSLLELLIVITILGVVTLMATLAWTPGGDRAIEDEMRRLQALFRLAQEETRLNGRALVWEADASGYAFRPVDATSPGPLALPFAQRGWLPGVRHVASDPIMFEREPLLNPAQIVLGTGEREIRLVLDAGGRLTRVE